MSRIYSLLLLLLYLLSATVYAENKVLYVTHEPGRWHDYTAQLASFKTISNEADWDLTVATGSVEELLLFLKSDDFGLGFDAIVYNFCLADSKDLTAMQNLKRQTEVHDVPALLIHCSMHSWWASFKEGEPVAGDKVGSALADPELVAQWQQDNPGIPFPIWGNFTGIASTKHGPQEPIKLSRLNNHPATADLPAGYATVDTELYNNAYTTPGTVPLLEGSQESTILGWLMSSDERSIIMWETPQDAGTIIGITLGHSDKEWQDPVFMRLLKNSVEYLAAR